MELKKHTEGHPEFANFDAPASVTDGQSIGVTSGGETPLNTGTPGQPKLKLTFSNPNRDSSANGAEFDDEE